MGQKLETFKAAVAAVAELTNEPSPGLVLSHLRDRIWDARRDHDVLMNFRSSLREILGVQGKTDLELLGLVRAWVGKKREEPLTLVLLGVKALRESMQANACKSDSQFDRGQVSGMDQALEVITGMLEGK